MSNYNTKEQLNKVTQSFSQIFDIKLSKVRHKVALKEGYNCHEAHLDSLIGEEPELTFLKKIQMRPGMFTNADSEIEMFNSVIDIFVGTFKNGYSSTVDITLENNGFISISDNSSGLNKALFKYKFKELFLNALGADDCEYNEDLLKVDFKCIYDLFILTALCSELDVAYKEGTNFYSCSFKDGDEIKNPYFKKNISNGFHVRFKMNNKYFENDYYKFTPENIKIKLDKASSLNKGLSISFKSLSNKTVNYENLDNSCIFNLHFSHQNEKHFISKTNNKNMNIEVVIFDTKENNDFECVSYLNDRLTNSGGQHENGLKKFLETNYKDYNFNPTLKGLKVVLLLNTNSFKLSVGGSKIISRQTKNDVYKLLNES